MKLRVRENSLRIRLVQTEVQKLVNGQSVEQTTDFSPSSSLIVRVEPCLRTEQLAALFVDHRLSILLPPAAVRRWAETDQVAIEANQPVGDGRFLNILIEKDFACLLSRAGDDVDAFPNPKHKTTG